MSPEADRNLLFGILALQLNFVDREALIAAMRDWVEDKSKPLGSVFVSRGDLGEEERVVVEMAVQKHLARHANDPAQSLAAMSVDSNLRQSIVAIADRADITVGPADTPAPLATLAQMLGTLPPDKRDAKPKADDKELPSRYRILRPHAKGGLGAVSVAVDEELQREVALKEIQPKYAADSDARQRFVLEAKVTGGLEHPGIVPVYGFGTYADGRPYYAMRFIRGESLQKQIEGFHAADRDGRREPGERQLALRKLLRSFVDVCNAIQYAHSRGVLHRDLKPDNVMIGSYGETLVVDWGLAKLVTRSEEQRQQSAEASILPTSGDSSSQTQVGRAVGTPVYMSPEQALGWHDTLTAAADVYSLGATLYTLVTGVAPVKGSSVDEVLLKVQTGAIQPPSTVNANVPAALEAIVRKAMSRQPSDRYGTPRQLADDVEAWLADEPVSAYPEPWTTTAQRWVTRHLAIVSGVGATLLVGVVSLTAGVLLLSAANKRESDARLTAQNNEKTAQANQKKAEENFKLARSVVDEYLVKVSDDPRLKSKGLEQLRHSLLETARKFHDKFGEQASNDPEVKFERASALIRLASSTNDIGTKRHAVRDYQTALAMIDELVAEQGWKPEYAEAAVRGRTQMAEILGMLGDTKQAMESLQTAFALDEKLGAARPTSLEYRRYIAQAYEYLGREYYNQANGPAAKAAFEKSIALKQKLSDEAPERNDLLVSLAATHGMLGVLLDDQWEQTAAEPLHLRKIELTEKARANGYDSPEVPCGLIESRLNLGLTYTTRSQYDRADQLLDRGLAEAKELCSDHPDVVYYDYVQVHALLKRSDAYYAYGNPRPAAPLQQEANKILKVLIKDNSDVHALANLMITCYDRLAGMEFRGGNVEQGMQHLDAAVQIAADEYARLPLIPSHAKDYAFILFEKGYVVTDLAEDDEQFAAGIKYFDEGLTIMDGLCKKHPTWADFAHFRAYGRLALGKQYYEWEEYDQARAAFQRVLADLDATDRAIADKLALRRMRAEVHRRIADIETSELHPAAARNAFAAASDILAPLVEKYPEDLSLRNELASIYQFQISISVNALNDKEAAREALALSEPLATKLNADQPGIPVFQSLLGRVRYFQGRLARMEMNDAEALRRSEECLALMRPLLALDNEDAMVFMPLCHAMRASIYYDQRKYDLELKEHDALVEFTSLPVLLPERQIDRSLCLLRLYRYDDSVKQLREIELEEDDGKHWYFRGGYQAIAAGTQYLDPRVPEDKRKADLDAWCQEASEAIAKAKEAGYFKTKEGLENLKADVQSSPPVIRHVFKKFLDEIETEL